MKKIISYSLWCNSTPIDGYKYQTHNMYLNGALENMKLQKNNKIYKHWIFRFYINNTVPIEIINKLTSLGAEIVDMTNSKLPGMFWRFLPFNDKKVDIFIVRDADSRINYREFRAVNEWIKSKKLMHIMRDHPHHYYKILGGMWGYQNCLKRFSLDKYIHNFLEKKKYKFQRMDDMHFLDEIYDIFEKQNQTLEHDQFFEFKNSLDFPDDSYKDDYYHYIGEAYDENNNCPQKERDTKLLKNKYYLEIMKNHINYKYYK